MFLNNEDPVEASDQNINNSKRNTEITVTGHATASPMNGNSQSMDRSTSLFKYQDKN